MSLWRQFISKFTQIRYFRRSVAMFALLLNVPILCLGIFGYMTLIEQSTRSIKQRYANALTDAVSVVDSRFSSMATMTTQFSSLPWISEYVYSKHRLTYSQLDQLELTDQIKELQVFNATNELLSGIILVLGDQQYVISSYGRNPYDKFFGEFFVPQEIDDEDFKQLLNEKSFCRVVGPMYIDNYKSETKMVLCISSLPSHQKAVYANIVMAIDCHNLERLLGSSSICETGSLSVYSSDGSTLVVGKEVPNLEETDGLGYWEDRKNRTCYFSLFSKVNGWRYIAAVPYDRIHGNNNQITAISLSAMVAYLILSCGTAFILAIYRTRPLEKLMKHASTVNQRDMEKSGEFSYLEETMLQLIQSSQWSRHQLETYRPFIRNSVFQQLLNGHPIPVLPEQLEEVLAISFPYPYFACAGFHIDREYMEISKIAQALEDEIDFDEGIFYLCDIRPSFKTVIINLADPDLLTESIGILHAFFVERGLRVISIGAGIPKDCLEKLPESYDESEEALRYCWLNTASEVVYYSDLNLHPKQYMLLPKVDHILGFLSEGRGKEAVTAAQAAVNECTHSQMVPLISLRHLYYYLTCQSVVAMQMKGLAGKAEDYAGRILSSDIMSPTEMQICMEKAYLSAAEAISGISQKEDHTPIQRVLEYIEQNYSDHTLSLGQVAEHFHISPSYVSRSFKAATGCNFLDYLNQRRIKAAKELLAEEETILSISLKVGFDTDSTFRRLFKKYTGVTPSRYKEMCNSTSGTGPEGLER